VITARPRAGETRGVDQFFGNQFPAEIFQTGDLAPEPAVPFSSRRHANAGELGNRSGVIPVAVPAVGDRVSRLAAVAATTTAAKKNPPGASTALLGPLFRVLARVGVYRTFIDHQRMVHTFVTNVRGPERPLTLCG